MTVPYIFASTPGGSSIPLAYLDADFAYINDRLPLKVINTVNTDLKNLTVTTDFNILVNGYYTNGDGGGGYFYPATTGGPYTNNNGTIIVPGGGTASSAWIRVQQNNVIDVKFFGAKGDGNTNDKNAIQAAIDYAQSNVSNGGSVYFPRGIYQINSTLLITSNYISLFGEGLSSVIKTNFTGNIVSIHGTIGGTKVSNISVSKLRFISNVAHSTGSLFSCYSCSDIFISDIVAGSYYTFLSAGTDGEANSAIRIFVRSSKFDHANYGSPGILLYSGSILNITDCFFNGNGNSGETLIREIGSSNNWDGLNLTNCTCENWRYGIFSDGLGIVNARVVANIFDRSETTIFLAPSAGNCNYFYFAGNNCQANGAYASTFAIRIIPPAAQNMKNFIISGNTFGAYSDIGIQLFSATPGLLSNIVVSGNTFDESGNTQVYVGNGVDSVLVGDNVFNGESVSNYGIEWVGTATARVQGSNSFDGFLSANTTGTP
jgi:hypothetical protein